MKTLWREICAYNWSKLISDILVAMIATALALLLERVKLLSPVELGDATTGVFAVGVNWGKRILSALC